MWSLRSWYWVWKMQGFPENGYKMLKDKMNANLNTFDNIQKGMWDAYGEPSYEFTKAQRGSHSRRVQNMRASVNAMFEDDATNKTISDAFEEISANWRDFSLEFVSVSADPTSDSKGQGYDFHKNYADARKALFSYGDDDSVRGLITFAMNRVAWSGQSVERVTEQHLLNYGSWSPRYFFDEYQRRAISKGAVKRGYLSDDVDEDFAVLANSYKEARDGVLLYGLDYDDNTAMVLAKTVWKAARNQFKYMLAMNDILIKAEKQMEKNEEDKSALSAMKGEKIEYKYAGAEFDLSPDSFWELFTEPSL